MKKSKLLILLMTILGITSTLSGYSQASCDMLQSSNAAMAMHTNSTAYWFGMMELPFLLIAVFFAFLTAYALKGGRFGKGMKLMAWGFLVMAVGHLHMQVDHYYGFNLFNSVLGQTGGSIAWFIALILTWGLSGLGFFSIYKASRGA